MDGAVHPPSLDSLLLNQKGNSNNSASNLDFNIGSENFPSLNGSVIPVEPSGGKDSAPQSFASCFKDPSMQTSTPSIKLAYEEPRKDVKDFAYFSSGELQSHITSCEAFVVGYFVGNRLDFNFVKENLTTQWNLKGNFTMTIHGEQAFMFNFSLEEDRVRVLEIGSVHIASKLFLIRPWSPFIEQQIGSISSVPIWMILRNGPLHLWNATGFSRITSLVGKPIMTDAPTAMKTRMAFARVCVEIEASCSFPDTLPFQIDDKKYEVRAEYPWKPIACSNCRSFGHRSDKCITNSAPKLTKKWVPKTVTRTENTSHVEYFNGDLSVHETVNADNVVESTKPSLETAQDDLPGMKEKTPVGVLNEEVEAPEKVVQPAEEKWTSFTRRKKNSRKKDDVHKQEALEVLNSFGTLDSDSEPTGMEIFEEPLESSVSHGFEVSNAIGNNTQDMDSSSDEMEIVKTKSLDAIPNRIQRTSSQQVEHMLNFSVMLGANSGCSEEGKRVIFSELNDKYQKTRMERELGKLGLKDNVGNEKLGRGHRKSAKKK